MTKNNKNIDRKTIVLCKTDFNSKRVWDTYCELLGIDKESAEIELKCDICGIRYRDTSKSNEELAKEKFKGKKFFEIELGNFNELNRDIVGIPQRLWILIIANREPSEKEVWEYIKSCYGTLENGFYDTICDIQETDFDKAWDEYVDVHKMGIVYN